MMSTVLLIGKICVLTFFGVIFAWNLIELIGARMTGTLMNTEILFEKQMWMIVSLLAIAIVLGHL